MNFFKTLFGGIPENGTLTATFRVDDDFRFQLMVKAGPGFSDIEYIQLLLNYYIRMVNDLKDGPASDALRTTFENVFLGGFEKKSNILQLANIDDVVEIQKYSPKKAREYITTIIVAGDNLRSCYVKLAPNGYEQDMVFSVFVLLQNLVDVLDDYHIDILHEAGCKLLYGMADNSDVRRSGIDFKTLLGSRSIVALSITTAQQLVKEKHSKRGNAISSSHSKIENTGWKEKLEQVEGKKIDHKIYKA